MILSFTFIYLFALKAALITNPCFITQEIAHSRDIHVNYTSFFLKSSNLHHNFHKCMHLMYEGCYNLQRGRERNWEFDKQLSSFTNPLILNVYFNLSYKNVYNHKIFLERFLSLIKCI